MSFDFFHDILNTLTRTHFAFWLRDPKKREHNVPAKLLIVLTFLIIALMALFGRGTSAIASTIYTVFFLATLCLAVFVVLLRSWRVFSGQVAILVEAYVVALFITMLLLFHNILFPIRFFSIAAGVDRSRPVELVIAYLYALPAVIYLWIVTVQFAKDRIRSVKARLKAPRSAKRVELYAVRVQREIAGWAIFHYVVVGFLIWVAVFARGGRLGLLNEAIKKLI